MKTPTQQLEKNIPKYYIFMALRYAMFFFIPIFVIYLKSKGLTLTHIMILQGIYSLLIFALEIPTGAIADQLGRKKTIALGSAFASIGLIAYAYASTFTEFIIAETILALGSVFISGADTALLYDTLKTLKKESLFKKIQGRANALGFTCAAATSLTASWLYTIAPSLPMLAAAIPFALTIPIALSMHEPSHAKSASLRQTASLVKEGIRFTKTHRQVRWLILYTAVYSAFSFAMFWLYQPFLIESGINLLYFGPVFAFINLLVALGAYSAHRIEKILGEKASLVLIPALTIISLILLATGSLALGLIAIILGQFAWGYSEPVINDYMNRHIASRNRATILSVNSLATGITGAIILPFTGYITDTYSLSSAFILSAIILLTINLLLSTAKKH
ncbi:MAG: MFS transporter [Candidatus Aenigmarchaeota archaeon]|nr:MFS transporter [Candidatus Aenigmarchaeota archaeon]